VRALALLVVAAALAGCAASSPELEDIGTVEEGERRQFEARLERELAAGRLRREAALAANRAALDRFPRPRGVELVHEDHQGQEPELESDGALDEDFEFWLWVDGRLDDEEGMVAKAYDWATYRHYRLAPGTTTEEAYGFYAQHPGGWNPRPREGGECGPGPRWSRYALDFERGSRCVWVHIGYFQGPVDPKRALIVATDVAALDPGGTC
jgi:hypothetical protein